MLHEGESTRAEIVRVTNLTSATVSSLLAQLIADGYVEDGGQAQSTGGKPPTTLQVNRTRHGIVAVIARPRRLRGAVVNLKGETVATIDRLLDHPLAPTDIDALVTELEELTPLETVAIAVQVPGTTSGAGILESVQLGWHEVGMEDLLGSHSSTPRYLVNDADAGSIAESVCDGGADQNHVYVHLGEGIGVAVTLGGRLLQGPASSAGEIGHVRVTFDENTDVLCRCGRYGCLEAVSSLSAMLGADFSDDLEPEQVRSIVASEYRVDECRRGAETLARTLQMVCATFNIRSIIIGGAGVDLGEGFIAYLNGELSRSPGLGTGWPVARYVVSNDPFLGAAQHALAEALGVHWQRFVRLEGAIVS